MDFILLNKIRYGSFSLGLVMLLGILVNPAFAELSTLNTNEDLFFKNEQILFSGTVEKGSSGLVTIVIRDLNDKFVLLAQAIINHDNTFEKSVIIKDEFTENGIYTANGFILNMTKGISTKFTVSSDETPIKIVENIEEKVDEQKIEKGLIDNLHTEPTQTVSKSDYADFVDTSKDPSYYVKRYYTEPTYKSWFDRNYPGQTIEAAVGYTDSTDAIKSTVQEIIKKDIIPEAQASSIVEPKQELNDNSDIAQISLAVIAIGILFGAVYGVKRQVDNNSRQISINKDTIRKKIIKPIVGPSPLDILQARLANGDISIEEFENIEKKLK
jgi:hypothetical protein